jgi:thiaminase/transcriptional activator TenA
MGVFSDLKASAAEEWRSYTEHPFTRAMADRSLPMPAFRHYLVQDYLFLIEFARAYALAAYKSPSLADMRQSTEALSQILNVEMQLHIKLCEGWGIEAGSLEHATAAPEMLAYTRYVLDTGMRGDLLALKVALAPCVIGYAEIARRLAEMPGALDAANPYAVWIAEYASAGYQAVAARAEAHLDELAERYATPQRRGELAVIFREASRLEADFWEMGWRAG